MDRVLWGAVLVLLLVLLVPVTHLGQAAPLPLNAAVPASPAASAAPDLSPAAADPQQPIVIDCRPLTPNPQQLLADCTSRPAPLG
jgi:hypothetical protein